MRQEQRIADRGADRVEHADADEEAEEQEHEAALLRSDLEGLFEQLRHAGKESRARTLPSAARISQIAVDDMRGLAGRARATNTRSATRSG
jgi:hypothetical protein